MSPESNRQASRAIINSYIEEAEQHRAVNHPYLQALKDGQVPDVKRAIVDLIHQYSAYSFDFTRYLTATMSQLENADHRRALQINLTEEGGKLDDDAFGVLRTIGVDPKWVDGVPHTELYDRALHAVGIDKAYRLAHPYRDEAIIWKKMFLSLCANQGPARALGAIGLGTENIVKYIYQPLIEAMENYIEIAPQDRVFFDLHAAIDDEHGETLTEIAVDYAMKEENREPIREGMLMALGIRNAFFDTMQLRANSMVMAA